MTVSLFDQMTLGGELDPTATYSHRAWCWLPNRRKDLPGQHFDGWLSVTTQKGRTLRGGLERSVYLVEEQPPEGFPGRRFFIVKQGETAQDAYEVKVGTDEAADTCTCKAALCGVEVCKHRSALRAAVAAGAFGPGECVSE